MAAKRMPLALPARLIRTDLIAAGYEPELSDIRSFMDSTLSLPENRILVANAFGYRPGARRGAVPKNLDALTMQAGLWNRQQADRRRRAAPPYGYHRPEPGALLSRGRRLLPVRPVHREVCGLPAPPAERLRYRLQTTEK